MKNKSMRPLVLAHPSEDDIRSYAYHLYQQSNCAPGQDLANWLEATAYLKANIPSHQSGARLHQHVNEARSAELEAASSAR